MELSGSCNLHPIDLRLFLQVTEAGSITHGARHTHLAPRGGQAFGHLKEVDTAGILV
jgi:hypothetical protein